MVDQQQWKRKDENSKIYHFEVVTVFVVVVVVICYCFIYLSVSVHSLFVDSLSDDVVSVFYSPINWPSYHRYAYNNKIDFSVRKRSL